MSRALNSAAFAPQLIPKHTSTMARAAFAIVTVLFLAGFLPFISDSVIVKSLTGHMSSVVHMLDASRGVVDTRALTFYLSSIALVLFATVKVVEARKWK